MIIRKFNGRYENYKRNFIESIYNFNNYSRTLGNTSRNLIKIIAVYDKDFTIKSFKIPNLINQIAYRFFRKSKAQRSFEYATRLLELGIGTPAPVVYELHLNWIAFKKSYYVSEYIDYDLTYRELTTDFSISDHEKILRAFTRFTFQLHQNGINFLDHSPGNTLICRKGEGYQFYLVDLNRMKFQKMDFNSRIKNFAKLTIHKSIVRIMSNEYARCSGYNEDGIFELMWKYTQEFQSRYHRRRRIKQKIFFWRKKYRNSN